MKRSFLDITGQLFRQKRVFALEPYDLQNETYYIYKLEGYRIPSVLREIEGADMIKRSIVSVNTQKIKNEDYQIEQSGTIIFLKLMRDKLTYELTDSDRVELSMQLKK